MTRGRAATPDPIDIGAVSRSGELFDALAARRLPDPGDDPAVRVLAALVADVDVGAPPLPTPARVSCAKTGSRRRVVRAVVTLGVTAAVLTTAGAAAAGGGGDDGGRKGVAGARAPRVTSEHTNGSLQVPVPERSAGRRSPSPEPRVTDRRRDDGGRQSHTSRPGQRRGVKREQDKNVQQSGAQLEYSGEDDEPKTTVTPTAQPSPAATLPTPEDGG